MGISGVSLTSPSALVDKAGGLGLRDQMRAQAHAIKAKEQAALAAAPDDATRAALKKQFQAQALERAQQYAAMICSQPDWKPKGAGDAPGTVLTAFYRLAGQKARAHAAREGRPFSQSDLAKVKLNEHDIEGLRKEFGDEAVKKAWPLLEKHICHDGFLTKGAQRFMRSTRFLAFKIQIREARDTMEKNIEQHREKLDDKAAENLRDDNRAKEKRKVTDWAARVVVERDPVHQEKNTYAVVGGKLVTVSTNKPE